jgi:hypothetical protein
MRRLLLALILVGLFWLSGCTQQAYTITTSTTVLVTPSNNEPTNSEPTTTSPAISSTTDTEPYKVTFNAYVAYLALSAGGGVGNRIVPTGLVMVKNTDTIQRTFKVEITHYYGGIAYTKEFTLQIEPGQFKTAIMTSDAVPTSANVGTNYSAGDWGIDYQVIPQ